MGLLKLGIYTTIAAGIFYGGMMYKSSQLEPQMDGMQAKIETMATTEYQMLDLARKNMENPAAFDAEISSIDKIIANHEELKVKFKEYGFKLE